MPDATTTKPESSQPQGPIRLHIGGWEVREGWKILDIQPREGVDFLGTCIDLSQFPDNSITEIYASHVYEHLSYSGELAPALREAYRVLKPGGLIRIGVPDLEVLCRLLLDSRLPLDDRFQVQRMIYGGQVDAHDFHKVGLTFEFLRAFLRQVGFQNIQRVKFFGLFKDATYVEVHGVPISLNVTAIKPV